MITDAINATIANSESAEVILQQRRNYYLINFEGTVYEVFEYLDFDGEKEPVSRKISIYRMEEEEELLDKDLEACFLGLIA